MSLALFNTLFIVVSGIALVMGRIFIARRQIEAHKRAMLTAAAFAAGFLIVYVYRWVTQGSTPFTGQGTIRTVYFGLLIAHSILAVVIVPFVIQTLRLALAERFDEHRRVARITFPMWVVVAVSGWVIYWMLYHL